MKVLDTAIKGVYIIEPKVFTDKRGYFFESYNKTEFEKHGIFADFVQDNQSKSSYGVVRGLHCQLGEHSQAKLVRVLRGKVLDVAVDVRLGSPTFGKYVAVELSARNKRQLFIPRNFLHGFSVLSSVAEFAYKVDNPWCKESEFGIHYADTGITSVDGKQIGVDWRVPEGKIITSEKDRLANTLQDLLARDRTNG